MEQLILKVKNKKKIPFIKELLQHIPYIEIMESGLKKSTEKKVKFLKELDESVEFVNNYKAGKTKAKTLNEFLDEL